jgi:hypothetical protein
LLILVFVHHPSLASVLVTASVNVAIEQSGR